MSETSLEEYKPIERNQFISKAIDLAGVGVVITDPSQSDNPIIYVNKGFEELTGYKSEDIVGQNCRFLQKGTATSEQRREMREKMAAGEPVTSVLKNFRKDGTFFWNELNISKVYIEELDQSYFIGIQKDITKQREAEKTAERYKLDARKLSLPIIPIGAETAIIPVLGDMDHERQQELLDKVGKYLEETAKERIILDLSGIEQYDEHMNMTIYSLDQMMRLMGGSLIIAGISPELAIRGIKGDHSLHGIPSFNNMESAIRQLT